MHTNLCCFGFNILFLMDSYIDSGIIYEIDLTEQIIF